MSRIVVIEHLTLDGVIDAAEGWFDAAGERGPTSRTSSTRSARRWRPPTRCCWVA
jgi:hypothetical protein